MNEQRPTGTRRDPLYVRPAGATSDEKRRGSTFLALVGALVAVLTAFATGGVWAGVITLVIVALVGGVALLMVTGDPTQEYDPNR